MPAIRFQSPVSAIDGRLILRLPEAASRQLPSRGQVSVRGAINGRGFSSVLEPDGRFGHWIRLDDHLRKAANLGHGETAEVELEATQDWPEPEVPPDLQAALTSAPEPIQEIWLDITPMARWEWVRWVNATRNRDTRRRRVEVTISKMQHGKRRPCCFDLSSCTDPDLSRGGKLIEL